MRNMKLTMDDILLMNALTQVSGVSAKDCLVSGNLVSFLVNEKEVGKAIGRKAVNVKELEQKLNKKIEIVAYSEKPENVVESTFEVKVSSAKVTNGKLVVFMDSLGKRKVLGNIGRLKRLKELLKRNYKLDLIVN